ncbi:MAG: alanine--tRNA ligase [Candidatus Daviesbacteria bacterium]|nr:MAG: alanine--tRNA ligase [Candidatus Daviesbacteria bacterium]
MDSKTLREKFLKFFEGKGHKIIPSASLIPTETVELSGTQKVLFTTAGMHPLIPYLLGEDHPAGKRLTNVQKSLRTDDIDEVGDATHHTFFEMLGNWSLGDYWKKEAIGWSWEFLTQELGLDKEKLAVSVFGGDKDAPFDSQSYEIWQSLGITESRIAHLSKKDNWWGPVGNSGPCGPDTEMFYWVGEGAAPEKFDPEDNNWVEIWNDVFMQYNKKADGSFEELQQKNVDTGMGLERALAVINGKKSNYETDLFEEIYQKIESLTTTSEVRYIRVIADHLRAATFLIAAGVQPGNSDRGYVLRRLIRRAIRSAHRSGIKAGFTGEIVQLIIVKMSDVYPELKEQEKNILQTLADEETRFREPINWLEQYRQDLIAAKEQGFIKKIGQIPILEKEKASGEYIFENYQTYGVPPDLAEDVIQELGLEFDRAGFERVSKEHQEKSRSGSAGMFKGGLADHSETVTKYHTATHLLHQALRDVLGPEVFQRGSNITSERLRFDFSYKQKMTAEEIQRVEDLINDKIKQNLTVDHLILNLEEAKKMNAIGLFGEKYAEKVSVYGIGPGLKLDPAALDQRDRAGYYSLEFCGGPHVDSTNEIGGIKIEKEEAISAGIRRIRAVLK